MQPPRPTTDMHFLSLGTDRGRLASAAPANAASLCASVLLAVRMDPAGGGQVDTWCVRLPVPGAAGDALSPWTRRRDRKQGANVAETGSLRRGAKSPASPLAGPAGATAPDPVWRHCAYDRGRSVRRDPLGPTELRLFGTAATVAEGAVWLQGGVQTTASEVLKRHGLTRLM